MENIELLTRPLFSHDHSYINSEGNRVGVIYITDSADSAGSKWVGEVFPYGGNTGNFPDHSEALVIAKLLAAAPDMLKALLSARDHLQKYLDYDEHNPGYNETEMNDREKVVCSIIDAIKKATE